MLYRDHIGVIFTYSLHIWENVNALLQARKYPQTSGGVLDGFRRRRGGKPWLGLSFGKKKYDKRDNVRGLMYRIIENHRKPILRLSRREKIHYKDYIGVSKISK